MKKQFKTKLQKFIKEHYKMSSILQQEINEWYGSEIFRTGDRSTKLIADWAGGRTKPTRKRECWYVMVRFLKKKNNVDVDLTWLDPYVCEEPAEQYTQMEFTYNNENEDIKETIVKQLRELCDNIEKLLNK